VPSRPGSGATTIAGFVGSMHTRSVTGPGLSCDASGFTSWKEKPSARPGASAARTAEPAEWLAAAVPPCARSTVNTSPLADTTRSSSSPIRKNAPPEEGRAVPSLTVSKPVLAFASSVKLLPGATLSTSCPDSCSQLAVRPKTCTRRQESERLKAEGALVSLSTASQMRHEIEVSASSKQDANQVLLVSGFRL